MKRDSKHAFTLTELLVLVPVAALLTTMLFAVSNDATQQLKAAACLNNMRLLGLGFMLYANDYKDYYPYDGAPESPCASINTNAWFNVVAPYIGQKPLCALYTAGTPPTPLTKSVWSNMVHVLFRCLGSAYCCLYYYSPVSSQPATIFVARASSP